VQRGGQRSKLWGAKRRALSLLAAFAVILAAASVSTAQDFESLQRDVATASDFRVRVGAALGLGKTHSRVALGALMGALDDTNSAVRAAAAAALAVLGQREAIDALRAHLAHEKVPVVRSQLESAVRKLEAGASASEGARVLVKVGQLTNLSGPRGERLTDAFRGATRSRAAALPGVELVGDSSEGRHESESRKLPLLVLDGVLNQLWQGAQGERMMVSARVEYVFRKMPDGALTGSVSGTARALDRGKARADQNSVARLEMQALEGAVESAMRGAPDVMRQALR